MRTRRRSYGDCRRSSVGIILGIDFVIIVEVKDVVYRNPLKIKRLNENAILPERASAGAAGMDYMPASRLP